MDANEAVVNRLVAWAFQAIEDEMLDAELNWCGGSVCACDGIKQRGLEQLAAITGVPYADMERLFDEWALAPRFEQPPIVPGRSMLEDS